MADVLAAVGQFHFLRPWWLLALAPVLAVAWRLARARPAHRTWRQVIAPQLLPYLVDSGGHQRLRLGRWFALAGIICSLALAGPTWSRQEVDLRRDNQPLLILFDLSPSMLAGDIRPDRLTRARLKAIDLLNGYREGSAALIAFAGDAHVVTPVTDDAATVISQLPVLHPDIMPVSGSNPEAALKLAFDLAQNAGHGEGDILMITDGLTPDAIDNLDAMLRAQDGFRLSILGVGSDEGAPIPLGEQGFARDGMGSIVIARLRAGELAGLAERAGGVYQTITGTDQDLDNLLAPLRSTNSAQASALERRIDIWHDRGIWLVFPLLPLALLLFRRGLVAGLLLMPLIHSPPAQADFWQDLWQRPDQQAMTALEQGEAERAAELFEDPAWKGVALHRQERYREAAEAFAREDSPRGHFNRGNALAQAGMLEESLAAYDQALARDPDMADARHNRRIVEELLHRQEQEQQQQQEQNQRGENQGEEGESPSPGSNRDQDGDQGQNQDSGAPSPQQPGESPSPGQQGDDASAGESRDGERSPEDSSGEAGEQDNQAPPSRQDAGEADREGTADPAAAEETDALSDAERQSAEQWLRRVPDDPGGLLRRKFEYESRQRFREERHNIRVAPGAYSEERW